ncbi:potassium channel family protein [Leptolyngbya sp. PCC 6406]|uniref:potassium channel family protein n=1 Tax=Leptolyngbya sp. PCC 6406 TaxID=1173264 RepID=UPI0002ABEA30|nr:NAD(P)-binding protein [Leptolyngbya sp. PCC 6406]
MGKRNSRLKLTLALTSAGLALFSVIGLLLWSEGQLSGRAFWEGLEDAIITLMGEYPDKPRTVTGRVLQLVLLVFGTFIFGAIIGKISSFFVTRAIWKQRAVKQFKNHIILCNWNSKAMNIVQQLLEANQDQPRDIVVVSAAAVEDQGELADRDDVHFVQADPTHHATLEKLQAPQAKAVILLADEESVGPDEKNALIALAIKHLEQIPGQQKDIHVIAELVNLDRRRHLQEAGVDEVVSARDYSSGIIAQSAMFRNMSVVYQQLLTYSDDTNEFYFIEPSKYPTQFRGKSFPELSQLISEHSAVHPENPLLLLGIKRSNGEILLNPKRDCFQWLEGNDSLIVMAFRNIDRIP